MQGRLLLLPAWLSEDTEPAAVLPAPVLEAIRNLGDFIVEDAKSARRYLSACGHPVPMRDVRMWELNEHTQRAEIIPLLDPARGGRDLGLLSEAGVPAVADPGAKLVALAHHEGIRVVPLVGPSSLLLALMASGLEGQRFRFVGYVPAETASRQSRLAELERRSAAEDETQLLIETPYRNDALLSDLLRFCAGTTRLAIAVDLTGPGESVQMKSIADWRRAVPAIGKRPAVFLLLAAGKKR